MVGYYDATKTTGHGFNSNLQGGPVFRFTGVLQ